MESEKCEETSTKVKKGRRGKIVVKEEKAPPSPAVGFTWSFIQPVLRRCYDVYLTLFYLTSVDVEITLIQRLCGCGFISIQKME